jgi:hypothetical protein
VKHDITKNFSNSTTNSMNVFSKGVVKFYSYSEGRCFWAIKTSLIIWKNQNKYTTRVRLFFLVLTSSSHSCCSNFNTCRNSRDECIILFSRVKHIYAPKHRRTSSRSRSQSFEYISTLRELSICSKCKCNLQSFR